jgi:hypothetical protein
LTQAADQVPLLVLSLSRRSRDTHKLFRIREMALTRDVTIVTANYMLRSEDVWVRRGGLVKPDSFAPAHSLVTTGLSGAHRKAVQPASAAFTIY